MAKITVAFRSVSKALEKTAVGDGETRLKDITKKNV